MWIERELATEVARTFPVVVLTGPRQVGKTSLVERTFPEHRYVSLDLASHAELAETRPADFLLAFPPPVVVDEVQHAPALLRHIKALVAERRRNGEVVLTGSQDFSLMKSVSESLAGRARVLTLLGLSGSEWLAFRSDPSSGPVGFIWRGGYPALWADLTTSPSRDRYYQSYVATYLERDVRNLLQVSSLRDFERFLRACAARTARTLNMSELARDVGISPKTARDWLGVLHASSQVFLLEPYHRSLGKRLAKNPKLYLTDTGLAAFLMGYDSAERLWRGPHAGAIWETHVVNQWLRWRLWHAPAASLWFWRDQGGNEVDLLIEHNGRLQAVECKLSERPSQGDLKGIARLRAFYGSEVSERAFLACPVELPFELAPGVSVVPGWSVWDLESTTPATVSG